MTENELLKHLGSSVLLNNDNLMNYADDAHFKIIAILLSLEKFHPGFISIYEEKLKQVREISKESQS